MVYLQERKLLPKRASTLALSNPQAVVTNGESLEASQVRHLQASPAPGHRLTRFRIRRLLLPLDTFVSDPVFSAFLSPDFDSAHFSSQALSSGSAALGTPTDPSRLTSALRCSLVIPPSSPSSLPSDPLSPPSPTSAPAWTPSSPPSSPAAPSGPTPSSFLTSRRPPRRRPLQRGLRPVLPRAPPRRPGPHPPAF
ncbi:Essential protein Yae1, N terminal [Musa troglodytarum]|uniref:Essential protein Yae1, N terminal n=1 Tax=Musa troglodytarum TaxID=320322 RepID=A0A9E7HHC6_9LILI|nr:Essential protein Yae1, N terminal [Musa troglodytarum]